MNADDLADIIEEHHGSSWFTAGEFRIATGKPLRGNGGYSDGLFQTLFSKNRIERRPIPPGRTYALWEYRITQP